MLLELVFLITFLLLLLNKIIFTLQNNIEIKELLTSSTLE